MVRTAQTESQKLCELNIGFASAIASRFCRMVRDCDHEEIDCDAKLGLVKAANGFSTARGVKFTTYAWPFIVGEICKGVKTRMRDSEFFSESDGDVETFVDHRMESPLDSAELADDVAFIRQNLGDRPYERPSDDSLSVAGIAAALGISRSAAAQRVKRAKQIIYEQDSFVSLN